MIESLALKAILSHGARTGAYAGRRSGAQSTWPGILKTPTFGLRFSHTDRMLLTFEFTDTCSCEGVLRLHASACSSRQLKLRRSLFFQLRLSACWVLVLGGPMRQMWLLWSAML